MVDRHERLEDILPGRLRKIPQTAYANAHTVRIIIEISEKPLPTCGNLFQKNELERGDERPQFTYLQRRALLKYFHEQSEFLFTELVGSPFEKSLSQRQHSGDGYAIPDTHVRNLAFGFERFDHILEFHIQKAPIIVKPPEVVGGWRFRR